MPKRIALFIAIIFAAHCGTCFYDQALAEEPKPFLGISFEAKEMSTGPANYRGAVGISILKVFPGGSAEKAGLKNNDTIVRFNGAQVGDQANFLKLVSMQKVGTTAVLSLIRDGVVLEMTVLFQAKDLDLIIPKQPFLRIETGMHTGAIKQIATDASGHWLVTASHDKSLRVWELPSRQLVRTIRPLIGEGDEGKLYSVALSPDGNTIVCGGLTRLGSDNSLGLSIFNRVSGKLITRITGLPTPSLHLAFSPDGRFLATSLWGTSGIRLYRTSDWASTGEDLDYGGDSSSVHFSKDNQLVTASHDGIVRLYDVASGKLRLVTKVNAPGGSMPHDARFSPDGSRVVVGYTDTSNVSVLSGRDLSYLFSPDTRGVSASFGRMTTVTWSADGNYLYGGGLHHLIFNENQMTSIRRWTVGGQGNYIDVAAGDNSIFSLTPLPDGRLIYVSGVGAPDLLDQAGQRTLAVQPAVADFRSLTKKFSVSDDGKVFGFVYEYMGNSPATFDLSTRLISQGNSFGDMKTPIISARGLNIEGWDKTTAPKLNGTALKLEQNDLSRSVAISPDGSSFVLGSAWALRNFDRKGKQLWVVPAAEIWAVNISGNGTVALAAYGDGTIRWHRMSDGKELLAFFPHTDKKRWVLWTPEGFFDHSPGGEELIGYHLNRGKDQAAEFIPISKLYNSFYRPDLINAAFEGKDLAEYAKAVDINKLLTTKTLAPKVRFLTKASQTEKPEQEINAEICDNGGGIGDVTLYLNNMPIAMASSGRGITLVAKGGNGQCSTFSRTLTLDNGDNVISLMAYNRDNTIESDRGSVTIKHTSSFTGKPNLHILTIAVDKYRDGDLQLKYSTADANGVAELLQSKGKGLFGTITRHTLADGEVTREKLEATFGALGKTIKREDMFILFVAGHGITYDKDGAFYFLPVNFRYSQDDDIPKFGVSMNDFKRYLANIQASKSLLLLDTCNSGSFSEAIASRGILEKTAINKLTRAVGRHTIVASSKSQVAMEGFEGHGAFSWTLLDGMQGKAANAKGQITVNSLVAYVESALPELTYKKWGYEQIPQKSLVGEDFQIGVK